MDSPCPFLFFRLEHELFLPFAFESGKWEKAIFSRLLYLGDRDIVNVIFASTFLCFKSMGMDNMHVNILSFRSKWMVNNVFQNVL